MSGFYWLASYPRSGNTWLRLALHSLYRGGADIDFADASGWFSSAAARSHFDSILEVESSDLTMEEAESLRPRAYEIAAREAAEPLIRKVHDAWTLTASGEPMFPISSTLGAVYIIRDPRDVAISFADFNATSIDEAIRQMADPQMCLSGSGKRVEPQLRQRLLTWSGHVQSWLEAPKIRLLVVKYEDMLAQTEGTLAGIAAFLKLPATAASVTAAVNATRFHVLKDAEAAHGFLENRRRASRFFRQGVSGEWRSALTAGQIARIERDHGTVMASWGYQ